jgi:small-conductance mechanosensitive channel
VREWIYKSDEAGKPRRFLNHREAILWAMITVGKVFGALALYWLINFIFVAFTDGELGGAMLTFMLTAILLVAWLLISLILYLYVALSGGVMDDAARRRYRNNETLSRSRQSHQDV